MLRALPVQSAGRVKPLDTLARESVRSITGQTELENRDPRYDAARLVGWLRKFGTSAWSVMAFQGVLMAWYGVNYILGAGLHSYGFGSGGGRYIACFVGFEILFVGWASWRHRRIPVPEPLPVRKAGGCPFPTFSRSDPSTQGDTL